MGIVYTMFTVLSIGSVYVIGQVLSSISQLQ